MFKQTLIMGVMNFTPDSFSGDGLLKSKNDPAAYLRVAKSMVKDGADILDIGGESTRPGAKSVSAAQEQKRILPTVRLLTKHLKVPISVDTYKADVALAALDQGASIINTIMGTTIDRPLLKAVRDYKASVVLMHMRGNPRTMQSKTKYKDVVKGIIKELRKSIEFCLEIGIKEDRIIIDPGLGFAKTPEQNLEILNRLNELCALRYSVLVGASRKSFIGKTLGHDVSARAWGTAATVAVAVSKGASIVRVHDVKAMKQVVSMTDAIMHS